MFIHSKCGEKIVVNLNGLISMQGTVTINSDQFLVVQELLLGTKSKSTSSVHFECTYCKKDVVEDEVYFYCSGPCHKKLPISSGIIPKESGGLYCEICATKYFKEEKKVPAGKIKGIIIP